MDNDDSVIEQEAMKESETKDDDSPMMQSQKKNE